MTWTRDYPVFTSQVLGLQTCTTTPELHLCFWSSPVNRFDTSALGTRDKLCFFLQAQLLVPMAAFTAPTLDTSPCISSPAGSMMGYVVSVDPPRVWGRRSGQPGEASPTLILALTPASDCCDGTDEYNSGMVCENTCRWVGPWGRLHPASLCLEVRLLLPCLLAFHLAFVIY